MPCFFCHRHNSRMCGGHCGDCAEHADIKPQPIKEPEEKSVRKTSPLRS